MEYWTALSIGLLGSLHCVGMCGPIALALPLDRSSSFSIFQGSVIYNSGRLLTYFFVGSVFGLLGNGIAIAGFQQSLSITVGLLMILSVVLPLLHLKKISFPSYNLWLGRVKGEMRQRFKSSSRVVSDRRSLSGVEMPRDQKLARSPESTGYLDSVAERSRSTTRRPVDLNLLIIGILNGLLPCGLVYMAVAGAIAMASPIEGGIFMSVFGLGTLPLMLAVGVYGNQLQKRFVQPFKKLIPVFIILIGSLFILRGMNLGIPYVSPQLEANTEIVKCH